MESQIDKFNRRKKKTEEMAEERKKRKEEQDNKAPKEPKEPKEQKTEPKAENKTKQETEPKPAPKPNRRNKKRSKEMADTTDWNEQLKNDDTYKLAQKLGIDLSSFTADSEDAKKSQLEEIKKKIKETENFPDGVTPTPEEKKLFDDIKNEGNGQPEKQERNSLEVNGEEKPSEETDWIKQKRELYEKFAHDQNLVLKNDPAKDNEEKSFTFSLEKDGKNLGEMKYTSPTAVQISKDSELPMYQGIVKDALENNLSISFGKSLDDKQKALLLAAVLMSENKTYANGDGIELKNAPQIDVNAEYFKTLPQDVQTVLKDHIEKQDQQKQAEEQARKAAEEQAQKAAAVQKIKELRDKVRAKAQAEGKNSTKELTTQEYRDAMLEGMTEEQKKSHNDKMAEREKILAARLGIIPEHTTIGKDGKREVIKEDAKTKELLEKANPQRFQELQNKYGGGRS